MKKNTLPALLAACCNIAGVLCLAARYWLLTTGIDASGLLISDHPGNTISWTIAGLTVLILVVAVLRVKATCLFPETPLSAVQDLVLTVALGIVAVQLFLAGGTTALLAALAALVAAACCVVSMMCRSRHKESSPLLRCPLIVFYLLFMVFCYQSWSSEPVLQLYSFQLLALVCLTMAAYQRAALSMQLGSNKMYLFAAYAGIFFCLAAIPSAEYPLFLLLMAVATVLDGCCLTATEEA